MRIWAYQSARRDNRRNGKTSKTVQTWEGPVELETRRDRNAAFEPELINKRETILADTLEDKIIGMYGLGMSFQHISAHLKEWRSQGKIKFFNNKEMNCKNDSQIPIGILTELSNDTFLSSSPSYKLTRKSNVFILQA